jgi:hypothetical protein
MWHKVCMAYIPHKPLLWPCPGRPTTREGGTTGMAVPQGTNLPPGQGGEGGQDCPWHGRRCLFPAAAIHLHLPLYPSPSFSLLSAPFLTPGPRQPPGGILVMAGLSHGGHLPSYLGWIPLWAARWGPGGQVGGHETAFRGAVGKWQLVSYRCLLGAFKANQV